MVQRSFRPGAVWKDTGGIQINAHGGGILFHEGVYYWFGEHKVAGAAGNYAQVGVSVYSSTDLYHWKNRGIALAVSTDPASPITRGCVLERPKVLYHARSGRFVMWFHLEPPGADYSGALSGVAVADRVTGPYSFIQAFRPNAGHWPANVSAHSRKPLSIDEARQIEKLGLRGGRVEGYPLELIYRRDFAGGQTARDQTLFIDPVTGIAWQFYASEENGTMHVSRLRDDDWLGPAGEYTRHLPGRFHEAPAPFFHEGRYWMFSSDCTGWRPNAARLSVAKSPNGPWQELGNPCRGTPRQVETTFEAQSTFVLPVAGQPGAFIFMADRWQPENAIDGRYVWLPVQFDSDGVPFLEWADEWQLTLFDKP